MKCLNLTAPFTREELLARDVSPAAADELLLFAARLMERHSRRHGAPALDVEDHQRDASPHRFSVPRTAEAL